MSGELRRIYRFSDFMLDTSERRLKHGNKEIYLPPKTFETLLYLIERSGHLIEKNELMDAIWADAIVTENALTHRIKELREALDDDAHQPRYIQTIPRVGYRFIAEVEEVKSGNAEEYEELEEEYTSMKVLVTEEGEASDRGLNSTEARDQLKRITELDRILLGDRKVARLKEASLSRFASNKRAYLIGISVFLTVSLIAGGFYYFRGYRRAVESLAVLPFENLSSDPEQEYFADGVTEALITDLAKIRALRVISRTSVLQYKKTRQALSKIAKELNVDVVVEGAVVRSGDRVLITARLIDAKTDRHLWTASYERDLRNILALQKEVSRAIAREIKVEVTPQEQSHLASARTVDPVAYKAYLKGRYFWNKRTEASFKKGIEYFEQAIEKDPSYALAYVGLADCYNLLNRGETFRRAKEAATKALEIDSTLAEAHASLAFARAFFDWDWPGAESEFKRSIELSPNYAGAHHWYGLTLAMLGRFDESLAELKRAQELDPLSLIINTHIGWLYYFERRYDEAIGAYRKTLEMDPNFSAALLRLGSAYEQKGMYEEAIAEFRKALNLSGDDPSDQALLAHTYVVSGRRSGAMKIIAELRELSKRTYVNPCFIATIYADLGEKDRAFEWLEKAYEDRNGWLSLSKVDPKLDGLRSDPRFHDLLQRIGLSP